MTLVLQRQALSPSHEQAVSSTSCASCSPGSGYRKVRDHVTAPKIEPKGDDQGRSREERVRLMNIVSAILHNRLLAGPLAAGSPRLTLEVANRTSNSRLTFDCWHLSQGLIGVRCQTKKSAYITAESHLVLSYPAHSALEVAFQ